MILFMNNSTKPFLLLALIICLIPRINAQASQLDCTGPTYAPNSTYHTNLIRLLSTLSSNANQSDGFYNTTVGQNTDDAVYGLYLCRGDTKASACQACVTQATKDIMRCPKTTQAVGWYDKCTLRYSDANFFAIEQDDPTHVLYNNANATNEASFMRLVIDTMNVVAKEAAYGDSNGSRKFATKEENYSSLQTLYTLAQCMPDLSGNECYNCLRRTIGEYPNCCFGRVGAIARAYSCNVRYELYPFYGVISRIMPSNHGPELVFTSNGKHDRSRTIKIAVSVTTFVSIMLFCFGFYYWKRKTSTSYKAILKKNFGSEGATLESLQFNLAIIEAATDKFSIENRIGKGGFGEVYMGILPDGKKIAVKRLSENSSQGLLEFKNEVLLIAKVQHRNLVALLGFCLKNQEKILVYEYVTNKSLDYFLFGSQKQRVLNWPERYNIIRRIAQGILYLHEHSRLKVIHRDLKPSNILLDDEMNPKISDFGLARMVGTNETIGSTNRIVGTLGYMSPEYIKFGLFSEKSDVFSFGVIVLEIVNGKKNTSSHFESQDSQFADGLLSHAWRHWRNEKLTAMLDSNLTEAGTSQSEIIKSIHISLLCVQGNPEVRPSMSEVVQYLNNDSMQLPIPREPAFFLHSQMEPPATTRAMESQLANHNQFSINEMSKSTLFPR